MKLCIDCKHHKVDNWIGVHNCLRDKEKLIEDPVTGGLYIYQPKRDCYRERSFGKCGKEGKFWEPKEIGEK